MNIHVIEKTNGELTEPIQSGKPTAITHQSRISDAGIAEPEASQSRGSPPRRRVRIRLAIPMFMLASALAVTGCKRPPPPASLAPPAVSVSHPIQREVTDYADFTARVAAVESVEVRARLSGLIVSAPFPEGALVNRGDVIVEIDVRPFQAELDARIADEARAAAQLRLAQIEYDRIDGIPPEARSFAEHDTAAAQLEAARASKEAATAAVESTRLNVEWCRVGAPIAGRISSRLVTPGNLVTGGTGTGTLLTTIVSVDPVYAYFDLDEATAQHIGQLVGDGKLRPAGEAEWPAMLSFGVERNSLHQGRINFVDNQVNPRTGTLRARGVFRNKDGALVPGYFGRVRVPIGSAHPALLVPDRAIDTDQGRKVLRVVDEKNQVATRAVRLGALHAGLRVIEDGLQRDDRVIVTGLLQVRPGITVEPKLVDLPAQAARAVSSPNSQVVICSKED
jgi:RND family efflux transporter MFP subunit